jgi:putative hydrolase of HD superfamily
VVLCKGLCRGSWDSGDERDDEPQEVPVIRKGLTLRIFDAANMQRWNDKICPVEFKELDKQAHKMIIAYVLGKFEESKGFSWTAVIEGGLFEFLHRLVLTDLKPQILYRIKEDRERYGELNEWIYRQLEPILTPLGKRFCRAFRNYFQDPGQDVNRRILSASHFYATKWEFDIIERANPNGYEIAEIKGNLQALQEKYYDLKGIQQLALYSRLRNFIDLCGQLRFQSRWSHIHRVPKTSVLGHMLVVAVLSYLFSLEIGSCPRRCYNNFFTGLFHDLPEVLTRDIISPVKRSIKGLTRLIKRYEKERMEEEVYRLIPKEWHSEMRMFTENEFKSVVTVAHKVEKRRSDEITRHFNQDKFNPKDGEIIEATDHLAAFIEVFLALKNGVMNQELLDARDSIRQRYRGKVVGGVRFGEIYADFD